MKKEVELLSVHFVYEFFELTTLECFWQDAILNLNYQIHDLYYFGLKCLSKKRFLVKRKNFVVYFGLKNRCRPFYSSCFYLNRSYCLQGTFARHYIFASSCLESGSNPKSSSFEPWGYVYLTKMATCTMSFTSQDLFVARDNTEESCISSTWKYVAIVKMLTILSYTVLVLPNLRFF